tara:strand:- start:450 stop:1082 length:633 start_codon:yes stop_codon:yes gene_type:complete
MKIVVKGMLAGIAGLMASGAMHASATLLSADLTVDNQFVLYISTDDSVAGTAFGSDNNWFVPTSHSTTLTDPVTYYLHLFAEDRGGPQMFIGEFSLADTNYAFANGGQSLLTNTTDWQGNNTGFGSPYTTLSDLGGDGTSPWGNTADVDDAARFIWTQASSSCGPNGNDCAYFSTAISYTGPQANVPVPATMALFGLGLIGMGVRRRRKH